MSGVLLCKEIDDLHSEIIFGMGSTDDAVFRFGCDAANRLAKLADDMLAALEAVEAGPSGYDNHDDANDYGWAWQRIMQQVRLAIADAKGGQA